jgi:hypothetical protein
MSNHSHVSINLSSSNHALLFIVFGIFALGFIIRFLIVRSNSPLASKLTQQDNWLKWRHVIRMLTSMIGALIIFIFMAAVYLRDPSMKGGVDKPIFAIGIGIVIVLIITAGGNWVGYKSMK